MQLFESDLVQKHSVRNKKYWCEQKR